MPCIGNRCPGLIESHRFDTGYCLEECPNQCVPASILVHIAHKQMVDKHFGDYVSVTSLLGCLRQLYMERTIDYFVEPPKQWWSIRGTLLHSILENPGFDAQVEDMRRFVYGLFRDGTPAEEIEQRWIEIEAKLLDLAALLPKRTIPNWQSETEYEYPLGVIGGKERFLRGTIDVLRPETGELLDYKTIGDKGLGVIKRGAKDDHVLQFNMYRLLVERGYPVGERATYTPITINQITAFYLTMMQVVGTGRVMEETTDWRVSDPTPEDGVRWLNDPEILSQKEEMKCKKGKRKNSTNPEDFELQTYKKFRMTYAIPDVPLMDLDEVERFVRSKAPILFDAFEHGTMPPMCAPEMRAWKCTNYCPDEIRHACDHYNESVGEKREIPAEEQPNYIQIGELG